MWTALKIGIRSRRPKIQGSAEVRQSLDAGSCIGQHIQLSAMLKSKDVESAASIFARITGKSPEVLFTKKSEPSLRGTREWNMHTIEFDVPGNRSEIAIG